MIVRLASATLLLLAASCARTVVENSPESAPPTQPELVAGIDPMRTLKAYYGAFGEPVQYPIETDRHFVIYQPTQRESGTTDGGSIEGGRTARMQFAARDIETGITSLEGKLVFDFICKVLPSDGSHWFNVPGHATLTGSFVSTDPQAVPLEAIIFIEFSGNRLWRECEHSTESAPSRSGLISQIHVNYSARAFNGSVMRATLPAEITGRFEIMAPIQINLDR